MNITKNNFEQEVLHSDKPVLIDFWAPWCGPCRMLSPVISEIAEEYGDKINDIISQYVTFTKVYNEQMKVHGRTREAIMETIRICKDKNVLKEYLESREKEVVSIMLAMYDEKEILREYIESEKYEAAKEAAKEADRKTAIQFLKEGFSVEQIARCIPALSIDEVRKLQEELLQTV